jgi:hypothetical protein
MKRPMIFLFVVAVLSVCILAVLFFDYFKPKDDVVYGATFSSSYVEYLNLEWKDVYVQVLDDLGVQHLRLPVRWSAVEPSRGEYYFDDIDYMMDAAAKRGAKVTLAIGMKVPRWPECYIPDWASKNTRTEYRRDVYALIQEIVIRYRDHEALDRWQVENEPFFNFGICPKADAERIFAEFDLVRELDPDHMIQRTTSGEQSIWLFNTMSADVLGASLYRTVYAPVLGYFTFPLPPVFYRFQKIISQPFVDKVIISELQAEPWLSDDASHEDLTGLYELFTKEDLIKNVDFANHTGVDEVFLWGVEWWYYLKQDGDSRLWDAGKDIFNR